LENWQRQHARRAAKAHGRRADDAPSVGSNLNGAPALIGEIEIDVAGMLRQANTDFPLGTLKLSPRLKQIEGCVDCRGARRGARYLVMATPQPVPEPFAADGPAVDQEIDKCGARV
jgi:hypothetical protein